MTFFVYIIVGTIMCFYINSPILITIWVITAGSDLLGTLYMLWKAGWSLREARRRTPVYLEGKGEGYREGHAEGYREGRFDEYHAKDGVDDYIQWSMRGRVVCVTPKKIEPS